MTDRPGHVQTPPGAIVSPPHARQMARMADGFGQRFILFVDTEEEFDWNAPFDRNARAVTHHRGLAEGQARFAAAAVKPVYVIDHPIACDTNAAAMLGQWAADGTCDVGAHLHPWVTPPHEEEVCLRNSYAGNLPATLERAKLEALVEAIERGTGIRPIAFRAGRYGAGPQTAEALCDLGFRVDSSVRSRFDYRGQLGPDYHAFPLSPYWVGRDNALLELPLSTAFVGSLRGLGGPLHRFAEGKGRLAGALSRLGLVARVPLTPEGVPADEAIAAIDALIADAVSLLSFSFHSPTLEAGHTPYVRDAADLRTFWAWWDKVLDHLARRGIAPATLSEVMAAAKSCPKGQNSACQAA